MATYSSEISPPEYCYRVEGMDCAECASKIETAIRKIPGASDPRAVLATQTLRFRLDESVTPRERVEASLRSLGYQPTLQSAPGEGQAAGLERDHAPRPWYATPQGRGVLFTGALLAAAFAFGFLEPRLAHWGYVAATLAGVWSLALKAWAGVRLGNPFGINTLVTVAAIGALLIGEAAEAAVVVFLFAVGELLEGIAAGRARAGIKALAALAPKTAFLLEGNRTREVPASSLRVGQVVQVRPGGRVPADGTILSGFSALDDSPVTGESVPVGKGPGDSVFAGSINTDGVLTVRVDKDPSDNTLARIIHLVEEAQESKAPTARFVDRFSRYYTPGVLAVAGLVAVVPPLFLGAAWHEWLYKGLALLLIGCPCALVLSVPAAMASAIAAGARRGLLLKGGAVLETLARVRTIAFDKTGTLTAGKPRVTDVVTLEGSEAELLGLAAAVEQGSSHPLAKAIVEKAEEVGATVPPSGNQQAIQGKGAQAVVQGRTLVVGSPRYAAELAPLATEVAGQIEAMELQGKTVVLLLDPPALLGLIAIRDELRPDAREALSQLKRLGVEGVMLTGDNPRTGQALAAMLGIKAYAGLSPEDKLRIVTALERRGPVAMAGDGINDAPALAQADVGIAMGTATDVALETADAAVLQGSVRGVVGLVQLSRSAMRIVAQNIALALGLKALFLATTLLGLTGLWPAVLADTGATALVTLNALRLLRWRSGS
ncbi:MULTISPECIES: heavy metal translocating P-type ATPase [unclassified Meiothermus]|uniref:heavy metal translocating P-type ATPase n=1 Tax=unclassified Meiothermus TaxID=370471 RepID=UPI000D7BC146|nr:MULTISPECIES: heavy metal translocating P-type ATPase [unclassified Meiothermus]PZA08342.1 cadmium-translocating P-type ATPase [Meiothermus sp. Pnk-1]RYM39011.1 cadmium-translocating P-type ATPase [Meiothermus sp. PNK-Is4]